MSFAQRRLWFLDSLRPGTPGDLLPLALRVRGDLDEKALTGAFEAVLARHDVLRTRYPSVDGEPVAVVEPVVEVPWDHRDLRSLPSQERESRLTGLIAAELVRPLPLDTAPPLRLTLVRLGDQEHLLLIVVHHIAFDFFSWPVLTRELAAGYQARTGGAGAEPEPLPLQYADTAVSQAARLAGPRGERQLAYWRERLAGLEPLGLPADRPRPAIWTAPPTSPASPFRPNSQPRWTGWPENTGPRASWCCSPPSRPHSGRLADRDDVAVGTPVSGRGGPLSVS